MRSVLIHLRACSVLARLGATLLLTATVGTLAAAAPQTVADAKRVSIEYTLFLDDGTTAASNVGGDPIVFTPGDGTLVVALEAAIGSLHVGDRQTVELGPDQAYGPVRDDMERDVPLNLVPLEGRVVGMRLLIGDGEDMPFPVKVKAIDTERELVTLDLNHPLAGRGLKFDIRILGIE